MPLPGIQTVLWSTIFVVRIAVCVPQTNEMSRLHTLTVIHTSNYSRFLHEAFHAAQLKEMPVCLKKKIPKDFGTVNPHVVMEKLRYLGLMAS